MPVPSKPMPIPPAPAPKPGHSIGVHPTQPVHVVRPPSEVHHEKPSHLASPQTQVNQRQASEALQRFRSQYPQRVEHARGVGREFREVYHERLVQRQEVCVTYYEKKEYRYYYSSYFSRGFYGGYYYPVRPCTDIDTYFSYPIVEWLYVETPEAETYEGYYGEDTVQKYPVTPFEFARVFYPTDTLRDLAVEVSGMISYRQASFRDALTKFTVKLQSQLSENLQASFEFADNDVVLNHYENYMNSIIVVEGFVDRGELHASFKGLLDLEHPERSLVFVPMGPEATPDELANLKAINDRIVAAGGNPFTAQDEPAPEDDGGNQ